MSNAKKELKERMLVNNAMSNIKRQIALLEKSRNKYIEFAKDARLNGIKSQYDVAKSAIRMATQQKNVLEQMLLNIEISSQIKDVSNMTKTFADGMGLLSGSITETTTNMNFEKTTELMNKAVIGTQAKNVELNTLLETTGSTFENMSSTSGVSNDEIDALIDSELSMSDTPTADLSKQIDDLEKKLNKN